MSHINHMCFRTTLELCQLRCFKYMLLIYQIYKIYFTYKGPDVRVICPCPKIYFTYKGPDIRVIRPCSKILKFAAKKLHLKSYKLSHCLYKFSNVDFCTSASALEGANKGMCVTIVYLFTCNMQNVACGNANVDLNFEIITSATNYMKYNH